LLITTGACAMGALIALWRRRFGWARAAAVGEVSLVLLGWGLAQYPYLVVPDVTFHDARAADSTLRLLVSALAAGALLLFPSYGYLFFVFKRRSGATRARRIP
jgi:cytochrome d ubiquinol oxidase subunit II